MHLPPRWSGVALEQIRSVGLRVRAMGVVLLATLSIYAAVAIRVAMNEHAAELAHVRHGTTSFGFTPEISVIIMYLALIFPAVMWHDENPTRRTYHSSMPVNRSTHALTRTFAGWIWMMLGTLLFLLFVFGVDNITRRVAGAPSLHPSSVELWEWLVPCTSVTIAYLVSSAAAVGTQTPAVWLVGVPVIYAGASFVAGLLGLQSLAVSMLKLFTGLYGAGAALAGGIDKIDALGNAIGGPNAARWLGATVIWGAVAAALLYAVSRRRNEVK